MNILKPGQNVVLNEGIGGEESTKIIGRISSIAIYSDMSVNYRVEWWNDRTRLSDWFTPQQIAESDDAEYMKLDPVTVAT